MGQPVPVPAVTISRMTEQAAILYIATLGLVNPDNTPFTSIVCGKASSSKAAPLVVAYAEKAKRDDNFSGNAHVTLHVMTKSILSVDTNNVDPVIASDAFTALIFNAFNLGHAGDNAKLADQLNLQGIPNFTALMSQVIGEDAAVEGDCWVETISLDIYAAQAAGL